MKIQYKPKNAAKIKDRYEIIIISLLLYSIGLIMILSSTSINLLLQNENPFFYFKKQLFFGLISLIALFIFSNLNYKWLQSKLKIFTILMVVILIILLITSKSIKGANSWFNIGGFGLQPAEFAKIVLILSLSKLLSKKPKNYLRNSLLLIGLFLCLVVAQSDIGTATLMATVSVGLLFLSGINILYILLLIGIGVLGLFSLAKLEPYRWTRLTIFLDPFKDPYGTGYQIIQSLYAIAEGGILGKGYGNSVIKHGFLPELHTDFIFSIFVEEFGFVGASILVLLFILFLIKVFNIAYKLEDKFDVLVVSGIGLLFATEIMLNLGVAVSIIPVTGVTLPFFSYGGSSLLSKFIAVGIVSGIVKQTNYEDLSFYKRKKELLEKKEEKKALKKKKSIEKMLKKNKRNKNIKLRRI